MTQRDADTTPRSTASSEGANGAATNQTTNQTTNQPGSPATRRRRAPARPRAGQQAQSQQMQSTQAAPAAPTAAPVSEPTTPSGEAHQSTPSTSTQQSAASTAEAAPTTKPTRTHRGRGGRGRRSGGATVVVPPAPEAATEEAAAVAAEVDEGPAGQPTPDVDLTGTVPPEIVPASEIRAEEHAASTPPAFESPAAESDLRAATAEPVWSPETLAPSTPETSAASTPSAPRPRYRFERRTPAASVQPAPVVRPERLSGRFAASLPGVGGTAYQAAPAELTAEQQMSAETAEQSAISPEVRVTQPSAPETAPIETTESAATLTSQAEAEQAEETHEAAMRRRRRRRRVTPTTERAAGQAGEAEVHEAEAAAAPREGGNGFEATYAPGGELETGYVPYAPYVPGAGREPAERYQSSPIQPYVQPSEPSWSITQGQQQIRQVGSPFGAPEPSFAEGFGPQPRGVAQPYREALTRTTRPEREAPTISPNQLAQVIGTAIQQQTDRLIAELRRQAVTPPNVTVAMPASQSTERVGIFVDVANLIYSARNMRMAVDFGRLLDFLRGNRRLIRAHAYAPTSPEPHAEQAFLSVVKGVGYRITTKNYKTFSSGAKKADLDLDMCMDIVRLVDGAAIDTVVLVSGDSDFLPVLEWASDKGVRIEVAAFEDAASAVLRQSCDLFVNLSLVPDIRA